MRDKTFIRVKNGRAVHPSPDDERKQVSRVVDPGYDARKDQPYPQIENGLQQYGRYDQQPQPGDLFHWRDDRNDQEHRENQRDIRHHFPNVDTDGQGGAREVEGLDNRFVAMYRSGAAGYGT